MLSDEDLGHLPPIELVIGGPGGHPVVERGEFTLLYGKTDHGKSMVALDMMLSVATGRPWAGHPVKQGPVVLLQLENIRALKPRIDAWKQARGIHGPIRDFHAVNIFQLRPTLSHPDALDKLFALLRKVQPVLFVIDTLARFEGKADENDTRDMNLTVEQIDKIKAEVGCGVIVVHHTGKQAAAGPRGGSSLSAASTVVLKVTKDQGKGTITVKCELANNGSGKLSAPLRLCQAAGSACIAPTSSAVGNGSVAKPDASTILVELLRDAPDGLTSRDLERDYKPQAVSRMAWRRAKKDAVEAGWILQERNPGKGGGYLFRLADLRVIKDDDPLKQAVGA